MRSILFVTLFCTAFQTWAVTTVCNLPSDSDFKQVAWSLTTRKARITDNTGKRLEGRVTRFRESGGGYKTNIHISHRTPHLGADASELVIFSTYNAYRVIGAAYSYDKGRYHLEHFYRNAQAKCVDI